MRRIRQHTTDQTGVQAQLDAAFAFVQSAKSRFDSGDSSARAAARDYVLNATGNVRKTIETDQLTGVEIALIEAKIQALIRSAERICDNGI